MDSHFSETARAVSMLSSIHSSSSIKGKTWRGHALRWSHILALPCRGVLTVIVLVLVILVPVVKPLRTEVNALFEQQEPYFVLAWALFIELCLVAVWLWYRIWIREGWLKYLSRRTAYWSKQLPQVKKMLELESSKILAEYGNKFIQNNDPYECHKLPEQGLSKEEIRSALMAKLEIDHEMVKHAKPTGTIYHGSEEHEQFLSEISAKWAFANPLHPFLWPSLRQMEAEVVRMIINMYHGDSKCVGAFTSGGTESILLAMKAYRDYGRQELGILKPNVVVSSTAHAAFDKAGQYFGIVIHHVPADPNTQEADVAAMARYVNPNTVALVGSACQFPSGTVDPIRKLGELARAKSIGLHVDCCLGGFLVPFMRTCGFEIPDFDFGVPGVTSISCDPHKYGFAPKGASVVMFSRQELRQYMFSHVTKWSGGIYATTNLTGSRTGSPVAGTWAAMCMFGLSGYVETTRKIVSTTVAIAKGVQKIDGLKMVGRPDVCVVAFTGAEGSGVNCYSVLDCMKQHFHWELQACQNPSCVHFAVTLATCDAASETFVKDLQECVKIVRADGKDKFASTAGLYGTTQALPGEFVEECSIAYLSQQCDALGDGSRSIEERDSEFV